MKTLAAAHKWACDHWTGTNCMSVIEAAACGFVLNIQTSDAPTLTK